MFHFYFIQGKLTALEAKDEELSANVLTALYKTGRRRHVPLHCCFYNRIVCSREVVSVQLLAEQLTYLPSISNRSSARPYTAPMRATPCGTGSDLQNENRQEIYLLPISSLYQASGGDMPSTYVGSLEAKHFSITVQFLSILQCTKVILANNPI